MWCWLVALALAGLVAWGYFWFTKKAAQMAAADDAERERLAAEWRRRNQARKGVEDEPAPRVTLGERPTTRRPPASSGPIPLDDE